ncbi:hypothetical protein ACH5RR_010909 [Cinchona calisaya]|uniref:Uncharacterized protein n=1 Tax=Cinchona calisaya TaxID=153742 RepID=A0ABD3A4W8_9GENT
MINYFPGEVLEQVFEWAQGPEFSICGLQIMVLDTGVPTFPLGFRPWSTPPPLPILRSLGRRGWRFPIARSFPAFKYLLLVSCQGFTTHGLAAIASNCRSLRELDLQDNEVEDQRGRWLSCFPDICTFLVSLNFACLKGEVNVAVLEGSLSGFLQVDSRCLPAIHPICSNLTSLNLSYAQEIYSNGLVNLIRHCKTVEHLWILHTIGNKGLAVVASTCKELQELRVFPSYVHGVGYTAVTEEGLVAISGGCLQLNSILYFCRQMTYAVLITLAKNCPNLIRFRNVR